MVKRRHATEDDISTSTSSNALENEDHGGLQTHSKTQAEEPLLSPHTAKFHRTDPDGCGSDMSDDAANGGSGSGLSQQTAMTCTIPGCKMKQFPNSEAYESHYV